MTAEDNFWILLTLSLRACCIFYIQMIYCPIMFSHSSSGISSLSKTGWWRSCRSVPGRTQGPARTQASPSCWHLQARRRTRCSEYQREGWAGGWSVPDAWTNNNKQFNEIEWDTNQSCFNVDLLELVRWRKRCTADVMLCHILLLYCCLNVSLSRKCIY